MEIVLRPGFAIERERLFGIELIGDLLKRLAFALARLAIKRLDFCDQFRRGLTVAFSAFAFAVCFRLRPSGCAELHHEQILLQFCGDA